MDTTATPAGDTITDIVEVAQQSLKTKEGITVLGAELSENKNEKGIYVELSVTKNEKLYEGAVILIGKANESDNKNVIPGATLTRGSIKEYICAAIAEVLLDKKQQGEQTVISILNVKRL